MLGIYFVMRMVSVYYDVVRNTIEVHPAGRVNVALLGRGLASLKGMYYFIIYLLARPLIFLHVFISCGLLV